MGTGLRGWNPVSMNLDGAVSVATGGQSPLSNTYTQIYRNGIIEAIRTDLLKTSLPKFIHLLRFEETVLTYLPDCFKVLREIGCGAPVAVAITLVGVGGFSIMHPNEHFGLNTGAAISENVLRPPYIVVDNLDVHLDKLLKPAFDWIWNAAEFQSSPFFNSDGRWIGLGR
jgi:hypothetical protein